MKDFLFLQTFLTFQRIFNTLCEVYMKTDEFPNNIYKVATALPAKGKEKTGICHWLL